MDIGRAYDDVAKFNGRAVAAAAAAAAAAAGAAAMTAFFMLTHEVLVGNGKNIGALVDAAVRLVEFPHGFGVCENEREVLAVFAGCFEERESALGKNFL